MRPEIVIPDAPFAEGPAWCPDGTLVITHVAPGSLRRIWPAQGRSEVIALTGGGANAAQRAADGGLVVTQNGGVDFAPFATVLGLEVEDIPPHDPVPPGLQRMMPTGEVTYLAADGFNAPNDLVVAADGTIYFTDPGHHPIPDPPIARVMAFTRRGDVRTIAAGLTYCNGIALSPSDRILVVEGGGLLWVERDGRTEWFVEQLPDVGDGFCFDGDGRVYVATPLQHCIVVLEPDGHVAERLDVGANSVPTNCCFGGADGRTLFTTELKPGRVLAFAGMPTPGLPVTAWPGLAP